MDINPALITATMNLKMLEEREFLALSNATHVTNGRVAPENLAYKPALALGLIREDGTMHDVVRTALRRLEEDRFGPAPEVLHG